MELSLQSFKDLEQRVKNSTEEVEKIEYPKGINDNKFEQFLSWVDELIRSAQETVDELDLANKVLEIQPSNKGTPLQTTVWFLRELSKLSKEANSQVKSFDFQDTYYGKTIKKLIDDNEGKLLKNPKLEKAEEKWNTKNLAEKKFQKEKFVVHNDPILGQEFTGNTIISGMGYKSLPPKKALTQILNDLGVKVSGRLRGRITSNKTWATLKKNPKLLLPIILKHSKKYFKKFNEKDLSVKQKDIKTDVFVNYNLDISSIAGAEGSQPQIRVLINNIGFKESSNISSITKLLEAIGIQVLDKEDELQYLSKEDLKKSILMKKNLEGSIDKLKKDPAKPLTYENLKSQNGKLLLEGIDSKGEKAVFSILQLFHYGVIKGYSANDIGNYLNSIGIEVSGERNPRLPTEAEINNDELIKSAIDHVLSNQVAQSPFLKKPNKGFSNGNIHLEKFKSTNFSFPECKQGSCPVQAKGGSLLFHRAKAWLSTEELQELNNLNSNEKKSKLITYNNLLRLLRELGYKVTAEDNLPLATAEQMKSRELVVTAINDARDAFLYDSIKDLSESNLAANTFRLHNFEIKDESGTPIATFGGQKLLSHYGKSNDRPGVIALLKELGFDFASDSLEGRGEELIEEAGLYKEISGIAADPEALHEYLLLATDHSLDEITAIVTACFKGLSMRTKSNYIQLLEAYRLAPNQKVEIEDYKTETQDGFVEISGKCSKQFKNLYVMGDVNKKVELNPDGSFKFKLLLKKAQANNITLVATNSDSKLKSQAQVLNINETGEAQSAQEQLEELLATKIKLESKSKEEQIKLSYHINNLKRKSLTHFTEDTQKGFKFLESKIKSAKSDVYKKIYKSILKDFERIDKIKIPNLQEGKDLYFYQKYAYDKTNNVLSNDLGSFIISLAPGLGKTLIGNSLAQNRNTTVVAPLPVVEAWRNDEDKFFKLSKQDQLALIMGSSQKKDKLVQTDNGRRVLNLEYLRDLENEKRFENLNRPIKNNMRHASGSKQLILLDESQFITSDKTLQSQGVNKLKGDRVLLSATPFGDVNGLHKLFNFIGEKSLGTMSQFKKAFDTREPGAIKLLHMLLSNYMVRLNKKDVFKEYDPNDLEIPLEHQKDRLPKKSYIDPEDYGEFTLTQSQCDSILEFFTNWQAWNNKHGKQNLTYEDKRYMNKNYFSRRESLRQIMNDPAYISSKDKSPKHIEMKRIVDKELNANNKVVIFCRYRGQVEKYKEMFKDYGALGYYGGTKVDTKKLAKKSKELGKPISDLEYNRLEFQNNPENKVLICTYDSGAVGTTFTAGDALIMDDVPKHHTEELQAENRIHRIDNERRKHNVRIYNMKAKYPEKFLERIRDLEIDVLQPDGSSKKLNVYKEFFEQGTFDFTQLNRLVEQRYLFECLVDGQPAISAAA